MSDINEAAEAVRAIKLPYRLEEGELKAYRPSNGTEGAMFQSVFCERCKRDNLNQNTGEGGCEILLRTMLHEVEDEEYPKEWVQKENKAMCTAFEKQD